MLSYNHFLLRIDEGLIKTHDIKSCKNIIDRYTVRLNKWFNISFDENKKNICSKIRGKFKMAYIHIII
jgi:hypothetical protein